MTLCRWPWIPACAGMSGSQSCGLVRPSLACGDGSPNAMDQLKFVVLDEEDLEVVSTHLQDAVVKVSDVLWRPQQKRVVVALNRFDWESAQAAKPEYRRRRSALRFERVLSCKGRDMNPASTDGVLNLLAVEFEI